MDLLTSKFSDRDRQILSGLLADLTAEELSQVLDMPVATVKADVRRIYRGLRARTRPQLAAIAVREGWVSGAGQEPPQRDGA
ncbi:MAG: LuxR C-terminal-related transcriptional regulator [Actinomycetota bacterium]